MKLLGMRRLIIRPGAIGDFVVSLPALEGLKADFTEVWCARQNVPLARFADSARSITSAGLDRLGLSYDDDVLQRLREFDDIASWYGAANPNFRETVQRLGLPFRFFAALPSGCHAVEFYRRQVGAIGARFPRIDVPLTPRSFAAIHPFASSVAKRAPMEWFEDAAIKLGRKMPVTWLAGPEEERPGAVRIDDLYDLACWLAGARVYVGNDSGISHLAAAVGTPVLAIFRGTDERIWTPRGIGSTAKFS